MFFDWLTSEGWIVLNWWLLATVAGVTALPLVVRLLRALPDRGYALARPAGILLVAFVFWLLAVLGFVNNSAGSMILAWVIVLAVSLGVYFTAGTPFDWRAWWQENRRSILVTEVLFAVLLVGWSIVRAYQNDFSGTEKMMDLAFMSAAQRSEVYPPQDPWLSGFSISYYYFGYVMGAMFSTLSGVWSTVGYNMHIAMLFALTGTATYGVVYNLVRSRAARNTAIIIGLLAMVFMNYLGNFHTAIVELPYRSESVDNAYLSFWDTKSRNSYETGPQPADLLDPAESGATHWWWFDASRSIRDLNLDGGHIEVIAEFPQFSFLLADSHPHVMALPYVLLVIGLALNIVLSPAAPDRRQILFYGVAVGSLIFLNTWDSPIYIMALVGADAVRRLAARGRLVVVDWLEMVVFGVALLGIALVAYAPFLIGFQSQLGGLLPNLIQPTRFQQVFVQFGPFLLILAFFLAVEAWRGERMNWRLGLYTAGGILLALVGVMLLLAIVGRFIPSVWSGVQGIVAQNDGWDAVVSDGLQRRFDPLRLLTTIIPLVAVVVIVARLFPRVTEPVDEQPEQFYNPATGFALLLAAIGLLLILIPEFVYLRDNFSTRMNTIFKFYYQSWVVFSISSAYAVYTIVVDRPRVVLPVRAVFVGVLAVVLFAGLLYPVIGIYHRMFIETGRVTAIQAAAPTLDGGASVTYAEDYQALVCLHNLVEDGDVVVAEATGGSYDFRNSGKVGALTGLSSIIGWQGHQSQWRGTAYSESVGSRPADVETLFSDPRLDVVQPIIDRYGIEYILFGTTERQRYGAAGEEKFLDNFEVVCEAGEARIYRVTPQRSTVLGS